MEKYRKFTGIRRRIYMQWNLCNPTSEFSDILWHMKKIYGPKAFLLTKIKPEYSDILYNPTYFPGPSVCRIRQVPLYIYIYIHTPAHDINYNLCGCSSYLYIYQYMYYTFKLICLQPFHCIILHQSFHWLNIDSHTIFLKNGCDTIFKHWWSCDIICKTDFLL
jgi:hypothetical protein